jgi:propionyl-CoA carboxylase alpha chain
MIAKLCSWGTDRARAIDAMADALDDFEVDGIGHNLPFLSAVMGNRRFQSGNLTTAFIAEEFPEGFKGVALSTDDLKEFAMIAAFVHVAREERAGRISGAMEHHRRVIGKDWTVRLGETAVSILVERSDAGLNVSVDGDGPISVSSDWRPGSTLGHFNIDNRKFSAKVSGSGSGIRLRRRGMDVLVHVRSPRVAELARLMPKKAAKDTSKVLLCPMPGMIKQISVSVGDGVEAGQMLAVVEAMKMENVLRSERKATVKRVAAKIGESLSVDQLIMEFE